MKLKIIENMDNDFLLEMSNVRGKYVKHPHVLPFSFYFSSGKGSIHSIRVKPVFNQDRLRSSATGTLKLSDDWEFIPNPNDKNIKADDIAEMKQFFKDNIVLFVLVWDEFLGDGVVADYLEGKITFKEMLKDIDFYDDFTDKLKDCTTVKELEAFVRINMEELISKGYDVNMYGN